jgi:hypothetical protein
MNNRPNGHPDFETAQSAFATLGNSIFEFVENKRPYAESSAARNRVRSVDDAEFADRNQEPPTAAVVRQTLDVVALLDAAVAHGSDYFMFMEDDFTLCSGGFLALQRMVLQANAFEGRNQWSAIRCSFGLAGIIVQNGGAADLAANVPPDVIDKFRGAINTLAAPTERVNSAAASAVVDTELFQFLVDSRSASGGAAVAALSSASNAASVVHPDLAAMRDYFWRYALRRPPDHLAVEFYAQESTRSRAYFATSQAWVFSGPDPVHPRRRTVGYRYNILRHDGGRQSTLRSTDAWSMPGCYTPLVEPQVFAVEAWNARDCPDSDVWPCDSDTARGLLRKARDRKRNAGADDPLLGAVGDGYSGVLVFG